MSERLISLARKSIAERLGESEDSDVSPDEFPTKQGVFVTLHKDGQLRGCIGYPEALYPLGEAVVKAAKNAAFEDPRFNPVQAKELDHIRIEVSVLTVPEELKVSDPKEYPKKITIGKDGLIIRAANGASGLLLPQVAIEQRWGPEEFLEHTCLKAGLSQDAWLDPNNKIYTFQCEIYAEDEEPTQEA